jgi:hypothetical protein
MLVIDVKIFMNIILELMILEKTLVRNYLEISEYNFRVNIIIKLLVKIIYGLVELITG